MKSIIVCNTGADSLSKISTDTLEITKIQFSLGEKPIGPHGIFVDNNKIFTANNYSDSISIFDKESLLEEKDIKIGSMPNDIITKGSRAYIVCGEANSLVVYDLYDEKILWDVKIGNWPHNIALDKVNNKVYVSNLEGNNVTVIDIENNSIEKNISTPEYPTKILVSRDNKFLYVCESYLGDDKNGYLEIFSLPEGKSVKRVKVGTSPIDLYESEEEIFVSNFTNRSVSIIDKSNFKVKNQIYLGGMPKSLVYYENNLFVADYLKGKVYVIEKDKIKKVIAVESEPNAMTLI